MQLLRRSTNITLHRMDRRGRITVNRPATVMHWSIKPFQRCCWTAPLLLCGRLQPPVRHGSLQTQHSYAGASGYHTIAPQQRAHDQQPNFPAQQWPPQQAQQNQQQGSPQQAEQQQHHQGQQQKLRDYLSWQELHRAAQIAAWSGLCYQLPEDLQARIDQQHMQLSLLAQGRNEYTAWFIADGVVPHAQFCSTVQQRIPALAGNGKKSGPAGTAAATNGTTAASQTSDGFSAVPAGNGSAPARDGDAPAANDVCAVPEGVRERFVFMRGVQWSAHDVDSRKMSQALMRLWPTPFPRASRPAGSTSSAETGAAAAAVPADSLVAHQGVAEVATTLFDQLRPYLDQADDVGMPICFAGHSLGGSLALLTMALYQVNSRRRNTSSHPTCYTFGSPPVLAHEKGGGGHRALEALGLPSNCVQNFVLENDPVPRALLSVDPTFEMLKEWSAVKGLLQLRGLLAGQGSPLSPGRFLFETVGQVQLIKWTQEGGSEVVPLDAHEIESELSFTGSRPTAAAATTAAATAAGTPAAAAAAATAAATAAVSAADNSNGSTQLAGGVQETAATLAAGGLSGIAAAVSHFWNPLRALQSWLDHHHGSYAQELEAAALTGIKREVTQRRQK